METVVCTGGDGWPKAFEGCGGGEWWGSVVGKREEGRGGGAF